MAEQAGLIGEVGQRIVALAVRDLSSNRDLKIGLNISPIPLMSPSFADLAGILVDHGVAASRVESELTERVLVNEPDFARRRVADLRALGFTLALDDFWQGFSSIGTLRALGFDVLKIGRAFVIDARLDRGRQKLCRAMVLMAEALDLAVVCEGIENEADLAFVHDLGAAGA